MSVVTQGHGCERRISRGPPTVLPVPGTGWVANMPVRYNAPEVEGQTDSPVDRADLPKCDIWAFGLLVWEACIGGQEYLSYLKENQLTADAQVNEPGFDPGDLLQIARRSITWKLGPPMFLRIALQMTLQKDPAMREGDIRKLPLYTRWRQVPSPISISQLILTLSQLE